MVVKVAKNKAQSDVQGQEALMLTAIVPGAVKEFCEANNIAEGVFPEARMHDADVAKFILSVATGFSNPVHPMCIGFFAAAAPGFPREKIQPLFAHVAKAVADVRKELKS